MGYAWDIMSESCTCSGLMSRSGKHYIDGTSVSVSSGGMRNADGDDYTRWPVPIDAVTRENARGGLLEDQEVAAAGGGSRLLSHKAECVACPSS